MINNFKVGQFVRIKGEGYIRKILDIRWGEALTTGSDGKTGYIKLELLELVPEEELESYKKCGDNG
jgi:hypothetical protein